MRGDSVEPSREAERREASAAMEKALGELPATYWFTQGDLDELVNLLRSMIEAELFG